MRRACELVATVILEHSDLHRGNVRGTWRAEGQQTLVTYDAEFTWPLSTAW